MAARPSFTAQGLLLALLATLCAPAPGALAQRASTYQLTCTDIRVVGNTLSANCRRIDGGVTATSILIPSIENIDGALRFTGAGEPSTYQNSCTEIGVAKERLFARCRRIDGAFNRATILIPGIENADGVLRYR